MHGHTQIQIAKKETTTQNSYILPTILHTQRQRHNIFFYIQVLFTFSPNLPSLAPQLIFFFFSNRRQWNTPQCSQQRLPVAFFFALSLFLLFSIRSHIFVIVVVPCNSAVRCCVLLVILKSLSNWHVKHGTSHVFISTHIKCVCVLCMLLLCCVCDLLEWKRKVVVWSLQYCTLILYIGNL